jgi:hypothetical protein
MTQFMFGELFSLDITVIDTRDKNRWIYLFVNISYRCCCGHDRMVVGFTTTCAISAYHRLIASSNPVHGEVYSIQHEHYVIL